MSNTADIPPQTILLDDAARLSASNGALARASLPNRLASSIRQFQHGGRPLFHWFNAPFAFTSANLYRFVRLNKLDGNGQQMSAIVGTIPPTTAPTTTSAVRIQKVSSVTNYDTAYTSAAVQHSYPEDVASLRVAGIPAGGGVSGVPEEFAIGPVDTASPDMLMGCVYEDAAFAADPTLTVLDQGFTVGNPIVASKSGGRSTMNVMRDRFTHVWRNRRPHVGYSVRFPDSGGYVLTTAGQYRYIFDGTIGDGGVAPSATGKGMTLPLKYSAAGRRTQVRVYVWVYARLTAGTGTGSIAVANKGASGTMGTMAALTNGSAISGTSFAWWPHMGSFDPATNAYFNGYAGAPFDRVLLGGKTTGTADLEISAFVMVPYHSTL